MFRSDIVAIDIAGRSVVVTGSLGRLSRGGTSVREMSMNYTGEIRETSS